MRVGIESSGIMAKIIYASNIQGTGDTLMVTVTSVKEGTSDLSPRVLVTAGIAIPLNNIAGWQTQEVR